LTCDFFATSFFTPSFSSYHSQGESTLTPFTIPVKVLTFL
jgi:hypothetical protein